MPSSVIANISYDAATAALQVIFLSGAVYLYREVPGEVYEAMKKATSKGRYLNRYIKGKYRFVKVK